MQKPKEMTPEELRESIPDQLQALADALIERYNLQHPLEDKIVYQRIDEGRGLEWALKLKKLNEPEVDEAPEPNPCNRLKENDPSTEKLNIYYTLC